MPSPIGHLIIGAALGPAITPDKTRMVAWCAVLAAAPDLDLLFPGTHRTVTHSVGAVIAVTVVTIVSILVTGKVTGVRPGVRPRVRYLIAVALILAFTSHLVLDWLGADPTPPNGLQLFWP